MIDPFAPEVREGFLRLVAGHRLRATQEGVSIEAVTRAQLVEATPMWRGYDIEVALLGYSGDGFTPEQCELWDARREALRAQIVVTRSLLERHSRMIKDPVLTGKLAARVAAIEGVDLDGDGLPVPDDADFTAVEAVLRERVEVVGRELNAQQIDVDPAVLLRSVLDGYAPTIRTGAPAYAWTGAGPARLVAAATARDPEIELVTRFFARDLAGQAAASKLLTRIYWQREALRQAVADAVVAISAPPVQPTKSFSAQPAVSSPVTVIGRLYLESLAELIDISHAVAAVEFTRRAETAPANQTVLAQDPMIGPLIFWGKKLVTWIGGNIDTSGFNDRDGYVGQLYD